MAKLSSRKIGEIIHYFFAEDKNPLIQKNMYLVIANMERAFSDWTADHSLRVGVLVKNLSNKLDLSSRDSHCYGLAACLHDIGKVSISRRILDKPSSLTDDERTAVQEHTVFGLNVFDGIEIENKQLFVDSILSHHESFDGTGYPNGRIGSEIPYISQIVGICDFYDAISAARPYRNAMSFEQSQQLLNDNKSKFNEEIFNVFSSNLHSIDEFSELRKQ
jgi:putative nucleotidyltransferase with HDIG domain